MTDREKVIRGLEACNRQSYNGSDCKNCPYYEDEYEADMPHGMCNIQDMFDDALDLLREQEPRVLTLEEVRNPERMMALEYKTYGILQDDELKPVMTLHKWAVYIGKCFDGDIEWTAFSLFHAFTNQMTLKTDNYGKTWRCWSADPGNEVRKETKWDEEDGM